MFRMFQTPDQDQEPLVPQQTADEGDRTQAMQGSRGAAQNAGDPAADARELVASGMLNENLITNEVFWRAYPPLRGIKLKVGTADAREWIRMRNHYVRPALAAGTRKKESAAPVVAPPAVEGADEGGVCEMEPRQESEAPNASVLEQVMQQNASQQESQQPTPEPAPAPAQAQEPIAAPVQVAGPQAPQAVEPPGATSSVDDAYFTQGGNSYQDSVGGTKRGWYKGSAAANTCNMTSLTMGLVSIAGSEEVAREKVIDLLRRKGVHAGAVCKVGGKTLPITKVIADPELAAQCQLEDLVTAAGIGKSGGYKDVTYSGTIARVAKECGLVAKTDTFSKGRPDLSKAKNRELAQQLLAEGKRVVAGTTHHYVYLVAAGDDHIVVHDPAGARLAAGVFLHGGSVEDRQGEWIRLMGNANYREVALRRMHTNERCRPVLERAAEIAKLPRKERADAIARFKEDYPGNWDMGAANYYNLHDIDELDAKLCVSLEAAEKEEEAESN
jgi:hypothetical protein